MIKPTDRSIVITEYLNSVSSCPMQLFIQCWENRYRQLNVKPNKRYSLGQVYFILYFLDC